MVLVVSVVPFHFHDTRTLNIFLPRRMIVHYVSPFLLAHLLAKQDLRELSREMVPVGWRRPHHVTRRPIGYCLEQIDNLYFSIFLGTDYKWPPCCTHVQGTLLVFA